MLGLKERDQLELYMCGSLRQVVFNGAAEERLHLVVDLLAQPRDLPLGDAAHAHRIDQVVDGAGRNALDVGFLNHGRQHLLGHAARLEKAWEIAAGTKLRDAQFTVPARVSQSRSR